MNGSLRPVLRLAVSLALAGLTGCAGLAALFEGTPERRPSQDDRVLAGRPANAELSSLVELIHRYRRSRGLATLEWSDPVARVAQAHSEDMVRRGFFSHRNPDGKTPGDRLLAAGIRYRAAAENIAQGPESAEEVFRTWVNSPGHRKNLEDPSSTHHGIGLHRSHWTHILIRPR